MNIKDNFKEGLQEEESKDVQEEKYVEDDLEKLIKPFLSKSDDQKYFQKIYKEDGSYIGSGQKYWKTIFNNYYDCFA